MGVPIAEHVVDRLESTAYATAKAAEDDPTPEAIETADRAAMAADHARSRAVTAGQFSVVPRLKHAADYAHSVVSFLERSDHAGFAV